MTGWCLVKCLWWLDSQLHCPSTGCPQGCRWYGDSHEYGYWWVWGLWSIPM